MSKFLRNAYRHLFSQLDRPSLKWIAWWSFTVVGALYVALGLVASHSNIIKLELSSGNSAEVSVLRVADDVLKMELWMPRRGQKLDIDLPPILVRVSADEGKPALFEATPRTAHSDTKFTRDLRILHASETSGGTPSFNLLSGLINLKIEVLAVGAETADQVAELVVISPLGFKSSMPNLDWLWWSFAWPIFVCIQLIWLLTIIMIPQLKATKQLGMLDESV